MNGWKSNDIQNAAIPFFQNKLKSLLFLQAFMAPLYKDIR